MEEFIVNYTNNEKILQKKNIVMDKQFGYLHVDPIPEAEELAEFYKKKYYSSQKGKFNNSLLEVQQPQSYYTNSRWNSVLFQIKRYFCGKIEDRVLLDIGCGFSQALLFFKGEGFGVKGIETSDDGIAYAKAQGLDVIHGNIEDIAELNLGYYDVVTLFEVLEHLREPVKLLAYIKDNILKDNGILVIDVPNDFNDFQLVANEKYDLNEWWVQPPEHINYFSADSLKHLLEACGYEIFHIEGSFPLELFMLMGDVYVGDGSVGENCHNKRVLFERLMREHGKEDTLRKLYTALAELNLGRNITVYAKRKSI